MINLNLIDADTGLGLGAHQVPKMPAVGDTFAVPNDDGFIAYEIEEVFTTPSVEAGFLRPPVQWARGRRKPVTLKGL